MPVVDVHAHGVPAAFLDALATSDALGATARLGGERAEVTIDGGAPMKVPPGLLDLPGRLTAMDVARVDVQLLSPWMNLAASAVPSAAAADFARVHNDALADVVAQAPDRLLGLANLPLGDPDRAAEELRRAVDDLGMVGAEIATRPAGRDLDDDGFEVLWRTARELDCLLLVHPYESLQGREVTRHFLGNLVGNPAETTIAVGHLVFGGVVDRHPDVRWVFVHGGGFAPYQVGRWDHAFHRDARGASALVRTAPRELLRTLWFDTVVHAPDALRHLLGVVGPDRVVLGSDHPFEMGDADPLGTVRAAVQSEDAVRRIGEDNARRLLGRHAERLPRDPR
jgi:aminocarboxymuconate-semialdehyde decarboxylase